MLVDRTVATTPALVAQAPSDRPLEKALTTWRGERIGPIFATYKPLTHKVSCLNMFGNDVPFRRRVVTKDKELLIDGFAEEC